MQLPVQYNTPKGEANILGAVMFILTASAMIYFIASTHVQLKKNTSKDDALNNEIESLKARIKQLESNA